MLWCRRDPPPERSTIRAAIRAEDHPELADGTDARRSRAAFDPDLGPNPTGQLGGGNAGLTKRPTSGELRLHGNRR